MNISKLMSNLKHQNAHVMIVCPSMAMAYAVAKALYVPRTTSMRHRYINGATLFITSLSNTDDMHKFAGLQLTYIYLHDSFRKDYRRIEANLNARIRSAIYKGPMALEYFSF